jgi:hypothetical protein
MQDENSDSAGTRTLEQGQIHRSQTTVAGKARLNPVQQQTATGRADDDEAIRTTCRQMDCRYRA